MGLVVTRRAYPVELVRVVDGDTVELNVDLGFRIWSRQRFRLMGVDTPERGEPGWAEASAFTSDWFERRTGFVAETEKADSFDRWLAIIRGSGGEESVNAALLATGHAVAWHRGAGS